MLTTKDGGKSKVPSRGLCLVDSGGVVVIVSFKPKIPENYKVSCCASESNKETSRDRTLDLPSFFRYKHITSLKATFRLHKARVCPTDFRASLAAVFVWIYRLREFPIFYLTKSQSTESTTGIKNTVMVQ